MTEWEPRLELPTPLELVNQIDRAQFYAKKGTKTVHELREAYRKARSTYLAASELRKLDLKKKDPKLSQADRDAQARLDNWDLFIAMEEADGVLQYARERRDDVRNDLSAAQTEAKLVQAELSLAR